MTCRRTSGMPTCPPCVCPDSVSATRAGTNGKTSGSCESRSTASSGGTAASAPAMSAPRLRSSETPATQSPGPAGTASSSSTGRPTPPIAPALRRPPAYQSCLPRTATTPRGAPSGASRAASASAATGRVNVAFWSMKSPSRQTRSGASPITASTACEIAPSVACGTPACRSATIPTRRPSSAAGQAGSANVSRRTTRRRGSTHKDQTPRAAAAAAAPSLRRLLLVVVGAAADVAEVAEVVEAAPGGAEARPDLLELGRVERRAEALEPLAVVETELRRQVVALEQADVVDPAGERLGRLDLDRAGALEGRGRRGQLPHDHVFLSAPAAVDLALERRVGQHLGGLLEGGRRQERVRRQRRLGDAEDDLLGLGAFLALRDHRVVDLLVLVAVDELPGQEVRVALLVDAHLLEHLAHDQLDVLVVDVHALRLVDLLHLLDEVDLDPGAPLGRGLAAVREELVGVQVALVELLADLDLGALLDQHPGAPRERLAVLLAGLVGDHDRAGTVRVLDRDRARDRGDLRQALGLARLEQLDDARQAVRDVRAGDAAGVERPHGQLRAGLADRLRGDDADRVADLGDDARGERAPVALLAHARGRAALEHRAHRDADAVLAVERLDDLGQLLAADDLVALDQRAPVRALGADVRRGRAAEQHLVRLAGGGAQRRLDVLVGAAVLDPDDHVLRDVDQAPGEVAGVGGAQGGVGQALAGAVRRGEVLEHVEPLHEVRLHGALDDLALRVGHEASHARQLADLLEGPAGPGVGHHVDRVELVEVGDHRVGDLVRGGVPLLGDRQVALLLRDQALVVLVLERLHRLLVLGEDLRLGRRDDHVVLRDGHAGLGRVAEAEVLERVEHLGDRRGAEALHQLVDELRRVALLQRRVDEPVLGLVELVAHRLLERALDLLVEDDAPDGGEDVAALLAVLPVLGQVVELGVPVLDRQLGLLRAAVHVRADRRAVHAAQRLLLRPVGQVVGAEDHVLRRRRQRRAVRGGQDVVARQHQHAGLRLRLGAEREVDRHLVAVEVGVERVADQRVDLDRLALDQHRLERLDAQAVQRRRAVEQDGVLVDDLLEHVPHLRDHRVDHLLGRLDVLRLLALDELGHDERLEQLERHELRQAALVQAQRRAGHDDRAAGVVDALAEQVLAEAALLALEHVAEGLQRPVARAGDGAPAAAVVEQRVDGLLEHPLLVVDDDLRRAEVEQALQPVVAVDDAAVEVVEVGGREAAAVELDHRAQLGRDDRHGLEDHLVGTVARLAEGVDDLQALDRAGLLLPLAGLDLVLEELGLGVEVDLLEQVADRLGAHAAAEVLAEAIRRAEALLELAEQRLVVLDALGLHVLEQVPDLAHALGGVLDVRLGVGDVGLEGLAQLLEELVALVVVDLLDVDVERLRPQEVVVGEVGLLAGLEVVLAARLRLLELERALLALGG